MLGAIAGVALMMPSATRAQKAEYEHRLDSLVRVLQALSTDSVKATRRATDSVTIRLGPLAIVADRSDRALVESAVQRVDTLFGRMLGSTPPSFEGWTLRLRADAASGRIVHMLSLRDNNRIDRAITETVPTAAAVGDAIISRTGMIVARLTDSTFRGWLGNDLSIDLHGASKAEWTGAWLNAAGTGNQLVSACMKGDTRSCVNGLDLLSAPAPLHGWYTPEERSALVIVWSHDYGHIPLVGTSSCAMGSMAACDSVFLNPSGPHIESPLAGSSRRTLTELALSVGPPGAASRLMQTVGTPQQRLATVAGIPIDSLVALWRANVVANHSAADITSVSALVAALLWSTLIAAMALRSSRWR